MRGGALGDADDGADLEGRAVGENVMAVHYTPFVTPGRGAEVILAVIDSIAAIPVFVSDGCISLPFLVLDVRVVVVMVLGKDGAAHKACGKDREPSSASVCSFFIENS